MNSDMFLFSNSLSLQMILDIKRQFEFWYNIQILAVIKCDYTFEVLVKFIYGVQRGDFLLEYIVKK